MASTWVVKFTSREKADHVIDKIEGITEGLWHNEIYVEPEEVVEEIKERLDRWLAGFYEKCTGCYREGRWCCCP